MEKTESYAKKILSKEILEIEKSPRKSLLPQLTTYEKAIKYKYSDNGYESLNEGLRKNDGKNDSEYGTLFETILLKLPNYEGLVYRGVNLTRSEIKLYSDGFEKSSQVIEHTFISTSKSRLIAMEFRANTLFRILSKTGKEIEEIAKFGILSGQNEKEVLFTPNCRFRVLDVTKEGEYTLITMEEL